MELKIHQKFPLLTFWNGKNKWTGFIKVQSTFLKLNIDVPEYPNVKNASIGSDKNTSRLISKLNISKRIDKLLQKNDTLVEFLEEFSDLLQKSITEGSNHKSYETWSPDVYLSVISDIESIGLENIPFMSETLQEIHVSKEDPSFRSHIIKFSVPHGYPDKDVEVECDLPRTAEAFIWPSKISTACNYFSKLLEKFDPFWTEMDELDSEVRILDPAKPSRRHVHRRIIIDDKVILHFVVNPLTPRELPMIQFYGPEEATEIFETNFTKNCKKWNPNCSILQNLQAMISLEYAAQQSDQPDTNCVICYMYELEDDIPEYICQCRSFFHRKCIQELHLNDLTNNIMKSNAVDCPVCTLEIKVKDDI